MVTRRLLLFVRVFVFLVHDDEAERFNRRKNRRARADDNPRAALANLVPLIVALAGGQVAVQDGDQGPQPALGEARFESLDRLRRERDFRDQDNRAFALLQGVGEGLQIDFGLAAAGDAVEEEDGSGARGEGRGARARVWDGAGRGWRIEGGGWLRGGKHRTLNVEP